MLEIMAEKCDPQKLSRLCAACGNDDIETVRMYIEQGVDLNETCVGYMNMSPLGLACISGNEEIMEELLKAGADPNQSAMIMAIQGPDLTLSMIITLISYGADVNFSGDIGRTALHYLVLSPFDYTKKLPAVKLLLENGASLYVRDEDGVTPLYQACSSWDTDLVKLLIDEGADVNSDSGHVALLRAAAESGDKMFDLLLNAGANRHLTPDALITSVNHLNMIIKILDNCDVDINRALHSRAGMTILHYACDNRHITSWNNTLRLRQTETVRLLLDRGADVRAVTDTGDTALHYAARNCDCNKIRQLLSYNPPLNIKNNDNETPLAKVSYYLINPYFQSHLPARGRRFPDAWYQAGVLAFKMLVTAGAKVTADVEQNFNQYHIQYPEAQIPDYEIRSTRSLKELSRFVIRDTILVPVDASLRKLSIPKLLQEYLNFPEVDPLVDEYNMHLQIMIADN